MIESRLANQRPADVFGRTSQAHLARIVDLVEEARVLLSAPKAVRFLLPERPARGQRHVNREGRTS